MTGRAIELVSPGGGRPAVVLLSGGLDSTTVLALARAAGWDCHTLSFDYGQRHRHELACAARAADAAGVADHRVATIDLGLFGGSALTDASIPVPSAAPDASTIPITYVPARNTVFLSFALAFAEVIGSTDVFIGVNAVDYSGYPDCRPEYIAAFETMADLATRSGVEGASRLRIRTPLIDLSKADIIRAGLDAGVDYSATSSCYDPTDAGACGVCDACDLRLAGFAAVGVPDPARYRPPT